MPRIEGLDEVRDDVVRRWGTPPWRKLFPWWPRPVTVRVLFYADGSIQYDGGPFHGLKQVLATLTADPYHWVRFEVTTVHRTSDPSADHEGLDLAEALQLDDFDELWVYSIRSGPGLSGKELAAAQQFMDDRKGGVLITGDHEDLGAAFGNLPRAGRMRRLPTPAAAGSGRNDTMRAGANGAFEFDDQSDAVPQPLSLTWYWSGFFRRRPHQVLCSPLGPIDIFPDHMHEGEAVAPSPLPATEWPGGVAAEVIARGTIVSPSAERGRQIGVLSAYDGHLASVGRIVADSTWHHHFDINLRGVPGLPGRTGFVTPGTGDWLAGAAKIEHFFVNAAIWLAPPAKQAAMRFAAWWPALWSAQLVQLGPRTPVVELGAAAFDALGRTAPQCLVFHWIWDLVPVKAQRLYFELLDRPDPPPVLEYLAGVATRTLMERFEVGPDQTLPREVPPEQAFHGALDGVPGRAFAALAEERARQAELLRRIVPA